MRALFLKAFISRGSSVPVRHYVTSVQCSLQRQAGFADARKHKSKAPNVCDSFACLAGGRQSHATPALLISAEPPDIQMSQVCMGAQGLSVDRLGWRCASLHCLAAAVCMASGCCGMMRAHPHACDSLHSTCCHAKRFSQPTPLPHYTRDKSRLTRGHGFCSMTLSLESALLLWSFPRASRMPLPAACHLCTVRKVLLLDCDMQNLLQVGLVNCLVKFYRHARRHVQLNLLCLFVI